MLQKSNITHVHTGLPLNRMSDFRFGPQKVINFRFSILVRVLRSFAVHTCYPPGVEGPETANKGSQMSRVSRCESQFTNEKKSVFYYPNLITSYTVFEISSWFLITVQLFLLHGVPQHSLIIITFSFKSSHLYCSPVSTLSLCHAMHRSWTRKHCVTEKWVQNYGRGSIYLSKRPFQGQDITLLINVYQISINSLCRSKNFKS